MALQSLKLFGDLLIASYAHASPLDILSYEGASTSIASLLRRRKWTDSPQRRITDHLRRTRAH